MNEDDSKAQATPSDIQMRVVHDDNMSTTGEHSILTVDDDDSHDQSKQQQQDIQPASKPKISIEYQMRSASLQLSREQLKIETKGALGAPQGSKKSPKVSKFLCCPPLKSANKLEQPYSKAIAEQTKQDLKVDYHTVPLEELEKRYESSLEKGLTSSIQSRRLRELGPNQIQLNQFWKTVRKYFGFFFGGFGLILWPSALLSLLAYRPIGTINGATPDISNLVMAILLGIIAIIQGLFNTVQDAQTAAVLKSVAGMLPTKCTVIRDGIQQEAQIASLVTGDIVILATGSRVPADLRLTSVQGLKLDTSMLTGESEPIQSTTTCTDENFLQSKNLAFMSSNVVEGTATGVVVATGNNTVIGGITKLSSTPGTISPLMKEIRRFVLILLSLAITIVITCIIVWATWLRVSYPNYLSISELVVILIGAVIAFVPDGLPISITTTLTLIAKRMFEKSILVKNLLTVETLGMVDIICSDKTGTLTQNKMSVLHMYPSSFVLHGENDDREPIDIIKARSIFENGSNQIVQELIRTSALCNRATFDFATEHLPLNQRKINGDASDTALLLFCEDMFKVNNLRNSYTKLAEIPFNSRNKWALTIHKYPRLNSAMILLKGAPEIVLGRCSHIMNDDGTTIPLTPEIAEVIAKTQERLSQNGERVLGFCQLILDKETYPVESYNFNTDEVNFPTQGLVFLGLMALIDPPREDVKKAVGVCAEAGIKVFMVTGDHPETALAIAKMVGIVGEHHKVYKFKEPSDIYQDAPEDKHGLKEELKKRAIVVRGADIKKLNDNDWKWLLRYDSIVFARTTPEDKLMIVKQNQKNKHTVAVTGDGVNDAPALKQADAGVAMGVGSEVAQNAADLVLLDNQFSSIVTAIESGRLAFDNLKKVVMFLIPAGSFSQLVPILVTVFFGIPVALFHFTFLNLTIALGTDLFPSLSLVNEKQEADLMHRLPRSKTGERLVDYRLLMQSYLFIGVIETICAFTMFFWYMSAYGGLGMKDLFFVFDRYTAGYKGLSQYELNELLYNGQTIFFVSLVSMQLISLMTIRTRRLSFFQSFPFYGKNTNLSLLLFNGVSIIIALLAVYLPVIQNTFGTRPIPPQYWVTPYMFALVMFILDEIRKFILRLLPERVSTWICW